jgi:hypothetical protein
MKLAKFILLQIKGKDGFTCMKEGHAKGCGKSGCIC